MWRLTFLPFLALILLTLLTPGLAIKCYKCDSDEFNYDPNDPCLDKFKGGTATCESDVCVKAKGEIKSLSMTFE